MVIKKKGLKLFIVSVTQVHFTKLGNFIYLDAESIKGYAYIGIGLICRKGKQQ